MDIKRTEEIRLLRKIALTSTCIVLALFPAYAQGNRKNEIGLLLGGTITPGIRATGQSGERLDVGAGLTFQATYAREWLTFPTASLLFEVPFLAVPRQNLGGSGSVVPAFDDSLFVTPGVRLKLLTQRSLSPWFSVGGGYALFDVASRHVDGSPNAGSLRTHRGALQFGAGVDVRTPVKVLLPLSLRLEVRDLFSGKPNYNVDTGGGFQHNVAFSGGFVLHF